MPRPHLQGMLLLKEGAKFLKFLFAGFVGLCINLGVTYILTEYLHVWYFWSFLAGTIISWTCSFFINALYTFSNTPRGYGGWFKKYAVYIFSYLIFFWVNAGIVYVSTSILSIHYIFSIILSAVCTTIGTFTINRWVIFRDKPLS